MKAKISSLGTLLQEADTQATIPSRAKLKNSNARHERTPFQRPQKLEQGESREIPLVLLGKIH